MRKIDYLDLDGWAAHPLKFDSADLVPDDELIIAGESAMADVFFVHPTTYIGKFKQTRWNAPIDDDDLNEEGQCKDHLKAPEETTENNYFFKMSEFQDQLIKHIEDNPDFISPEQYRNETMGFLKEPLQRVLVFFLANFFSTPFFISRF